jgi:hypothetical protein
LAFASISGQAQEWKKSERTEKAEKKSEELFGRERTASPTDPELRQNLQRFIPNMLAKTLFGDYFTWPDRDLR